MTEKQYSVWASADQAEKPGPQYETWAQANENRYVQGPHYNRKRIWLHNDDGTVTDATDGEPKEKWWSCKWSTVYGFEAETAPKYGLPETLAQLRFAGGELNEVIAWMLSTTAPTPEQFQAHVLAETGVEVPCVEKPQLWMWDVEEQEWSLSISVLQHPYAEVTTCGKDGTVSGLFVTATTETRDALRDEGLAWAAKATGKESEE